MHPVFGQFGNDSERWLVVNQMAIDHRLPVTVLIDWLPIWTAKQLGGVQSGGGGKADLDCIEVVEHTAVLRDVILFVAETESS